MAPPWLPILRDSLKQQFGTKPAIMTLASVDVQGAPQARSVVCRRITDDGELWVVSDARSGKQSDLNANPNSSLLFWLPDLRRQFRICSTHVLGIDEAEELWPTLSDATRAMFTWPAPGDTFDDSTVFPAELPASEPPPEFYELIVFIPLTVEMLDLTAHPHRRIRWEKPNPDANWAERRVNP